MAQFGGLPKAIAKTTNTSVVAVPPAMTEIDKIVEMELRKMQLQQIEDQLLLEQQQMQEQMQEQWARDHKTHEFASLLEEDTRQKLRNSLTIPATAPSRLEEDKAKPSTARPTSSPIR